MLQCNFCLKHRTLRSWDGYAIFYDLSTKEKIKKISLLDKRNKFDIAADCGCTFGPTKDTFYDIVYSDTLFISVVNQYNTAKMERERTFFRDAHFHLNDIGYSETEKAFWILGYERINYTEKNGRGAFTDNSEAFILWSENLNEFERYSLEQKSPFITSLYYLEEERNFIAPPPTITVTNSCPLGST